LIKVAELRNYLIEDGSGLDEVKYWSTPCLANLKQPVLNSTGFCDRELSDQADSGLILISSAKEYKTGNQ